MSLKSKRHFLSQAKPLPLKVNGVDLFANPLQMTTGSVGYSYCGKLPVQLPDGTVVMVQVGLNMTVVKSKELPEVEAGNLLAGQNSLALASK